MQNNEGIKLKVLIFGVSGMLGNAMLRVLNQSDGVEVYGTARSASALRYFTPSLRKRIISGIDIENNDSLIRVLAQVKPEVVVNCIGLVKQLADANDPLLALPINTMLPHRLAHLCDLCGARLVHISTDCVFSGIKGNYRESDISDAWDLYGKSKYLGELSCHNAITLRTSIIGHELSSSHGLIDWFLSQDSEVKGYTRAIFSGLPTVELSRVVRDIVLPRPELSGLFHVASAPISKFDLLKLVGGVYGKLINIVPDENTVIDRSLNAECFRAATGYTAPEWPALVMQMFDFKKEVFGDV